MSANGGSDTAQKQRETRVLAAAAKNEGIAASGAEALGCGGQKWGTEFWTFQSDDLASASAIHQHQFVDLLANLKACQVTSRCKSKQSCIKAK